MQSQNSQLVLSIYTSENGNKGGLDVLLGKKFITREKAPEVGNAGQGCQWRSENHHPDRQPRVKTWDLEGSKKKCENRVPLQKLHYIHYGPSGSGDPVHGTRVPPLQNLAMPAFM